MYTEIITKSKNKTRFESKNYILYKIVKTFNGKKCFLIDFSTVQFCLEMEYSSCLGIVTIVARLKNQRLVKHAHNLKNKTEIK